MVELGVGLLLLGEQGLEGGELVLDLGLVVSLGGWLRVRLGSFEVGGELGELGE